MSRHPHDQELKKVSVYLIELSAYESYCSVQKQCIFIDLLQIKDRYHCQESIIIHGVSGYERA